MKNRDLLLLVLAMVCTSCGTPLASSSAGDSIQDLKELFNKANFSVDYLEEMGINEAQGKASQNPKGRRPSFLNDDSQSWLLKYRTSGEWHSLTMEKNERQHGWEEVMYRGFHSDSEFSFNITFGDNVMGMGHLKSECPLGQDDGEGNILLPAGDYDFYVASYTDDFAPHRDRIWISEASEEEDPEPEPEPSSIINYVYDKSEVYAEDTENRIFILGADGSKRTYMSSMWPGDNRACSNIVAKEGDRISIGMEEYPARAAFITEEGLDSNWQHNSYYHTFEEAGTYDVFIFNSFDSRDPKQVFISRQKQEPLDLSDDALNRLTKVTPQESEPFTIASQLNEYQDSVVKVTDSIHSGTKEAIEAADGLGEIEVKGRKVTLSMENGIGKASYTIPNNGDYCVMLKENEVLLTVDWTKTLEIPEEYSNAPWLNESMLRTSIHIVRENGEMKRFTHFGPNGNFWEEGEWGFYYIDLTKTERVYACLIIFYEELNSVEDV
ncbi:MAG: hypothetical protein II467_04545, partial [Bacilli bacterium]|nr:hypothetical protein [Bacilli bacterium]